MEGVGVGRLLPLAWHHTHTPPLSHTTHPWQVAHPQQRRQQRAVDAVGRRRRAVIALALAVALVDVHLGCGWV